MPDLDFVIAKALLSGNSSFKRPFLGLDQPSSLLLLSPILLHPLIKPSLFFYWINFFELKPVVLLAF